MRTSYLQGTIDGIHQCDSAVEYGFAKPSLVSLNQSIATADFSWINAKLSCSHINHAF
jgi:hypothetical protein